MNNLAPVVGINNQEAGHRILMYLEERKRTSENTYKNYLRYYTEFFYFACNKEINQLIWEDIFKIDNGMIGDYKLFLLNKGDAPNYVNQKLFAGKALWDKLFELNHNIDRLVFKFAEEKTKDNTFASLDHKEMELLFDFMDKESYKPLTKRLFFEFLYIVGSRKNVAIDLKWNQITRKRDFSNDMDIWVIGYPDKGKDIEKAINDDFYNKLLQLKESGESTGDKVFDLNKDTFEAVFRKFQDEYNLKEKNGKKVCIHSIKKASGWLVQNTFGDINKTRKHLQHKNMQLTAYNYLGSENYSEQASFLIGKEITNDFLNEMTKEELITLIEKCGKDTLMKLYYEKEKERGQN